MRISTVLAVAAIAILTVAGCGKHKKTAIPPGAASAFPGSYAQSCRNIIALDGGYITAECADAKGQFVVGYLKAAACKGDIGNSNGVLVCNGAVATATPPSAAPASDEAPSDTAASDAASSAPPKP